MSIGCFKFNNRVSEKVANYLATFFVGEQRQTITVERTETQPHHRASSWVGVSTEAAQQ